MSIAFTLIAEVLDWFRAYCLTNSFMTRSEWVEVEGQGRVYLRWKPKHVCTDNKVRDVLVVANITITHKRQGTFKLLCQKIEDLAILHDLAVEYECVHNGDLMRYLDQRGYITRTEDPYDRNFWLERPAELLAK